MKKAVVILSIVVAADTLLLLGLVLIGPLVAKEFAKSAVVQIIQTCDQRYMLK